MNSVEYIIVALISFCLGVLVMYFFNRFNVGKARESAKEILSAARKEAETLKKEVLVEAKDKAYQIKQQAEEDARKKTRELRELEKTLQRKELSIERKADIVDNKTADLNRREQELQGRYNQIQKREAEIEDIKEKQIQRLEQISGMSKSEAETALKNSLLERAKQDINRKIKELKDTAIAEANKEARKIIISAIQRSAADHTAETTVSVVNLPNDNMKGRIIGREGRNIRHFESLTGVELIVDDTPEAVVLSGFDPIRREIARIALENLINDGRIHPSRIEEMIAKAKQSVEDSIFQAAEEACNELGIPPFQRDLMRLIGNLHYRTSYGQNMLKHSMEVSWLTGLMAAELGLDGELAKRAGFLHDIGKAVDRNVSGTHAIIGGEIARKFREHEVVVNAIESHHEEVPMSNPISALVQAADAISGSRRGARGDTLESYIHRLEKLEKIAESFQGVTKTYAIQAGRELRVIVENDIVDDANADSLADDIAEKIQQELTYPGQIKVVVIREHRAISYAK